MIDKSFILFQGVFEFASSVIHKCPAVAEILCRCQIVVLWKFYFILLLDHV